ncbi:MAG: GTP-binding protein [Gammaproteobacteria bacterium]|nr:GTP-binding protein [Gammaproteobacteria bacterium]NNJ97942.1 GTP-binding protein [Gammaproteobacteria bacterium]
MIDQDRPILAPAPRTEDIEIPGREAIPVTLLTGFLGSGKTTLLNRILSGDHELRVGVLVNDFGAINIDSELIEGVEENTINLSNGCICCEIRDDLVQSLEELLGRADQIDYVIVEASGVSDPEGIVMTFLDRRYKKLLRLDSITCIVDAEAVFSQADDEAITGLKLRQIGFADMVVLNKVDTVSPAHVEVVHEWIDAHFNRVRVIEATHCEVPYEILLSVGRFDAERSLSENKEHEACETHECGHHAHGHSHSHENVRAGDVFETWSFETDKPICAETLEEVVRRRLPASVFRCKGIFWDEATPKYRQTIQAVGRRTEVKRLDEWGDRARTSRIVAIGRKINAAELEDIFGTEMASV